MSDWNTKWVDIAQSNISKGIGYRHRKRLAINLFRKYKLKGKILDVGCGDGTAFTFLDNKDNELSGLDNSEAAIRIAKNNFPNAEYFLGNIIDFSSLPKTQFDIITCFDILEEIKEDELAIHNISLLLKDTGKLLITTQHKEKYRTKFDQYAGNVRRYEVMDLEAKLQKSNFRILETIVWGYPFYNFYYKYFLSKINPDKQWGNSPKKTALLLNLAFYLLLLDDLFKNNQRGRIILILAEKIDIVEKST